MSIAQLDVKQFYDHLDPNAISSFLRSCGAPSWLCYSALACQLLLIFTMVQGECCARVGCRTSGCLTGSRVAGALGHCVVADVTESLANEVRRRGFAGSDSVRWQPCQCDEEEFGMATWIDNIYAPGRTELAACRALDAWSAVLWRRWRLRIKEGSQKVLSYDGQVLPDCPPGGWERTVTMPILGHVLDAKCSGIDDWNATERAAWRRYWLGGRHRRCRHLGWQKRWRDIERCV